VRKHVVADDDIVATTGQVFLGLTVNCARCHDHKFDPIATKDYYQLAAIFSSTLSFAGGETGDPVQTPLAAPGEFEAFKKEWTAYNDLEKKVMGIIDFDKDAREHLRGDPREILAFTSAIEPY